MSLIFRKLSDLDLLLSGFGGPGVPISRLCHNDGGLFTDTQAGLAGALASVPA